MSFKERAHMRTYGRIAVILVLLYMAVFSYTCIKKYETFAYHDFDLAIFNQVMRNSLHGAFFYSSIVGGSYFRDHVPLILVLFLPFYALAQSPLFLIILQTAFFGLAGLSIWYMASRELRDGFISLAILIVYFTYPPVGYINLFHFHTITLAPLFLIWTYYFFKNESYRPFLAMLVLSLLCREDISFIAIAFGLLAFLCRRTWRWGVAPLLMGLSWGLFCFFYVIPHFRSGHEYLYLQFYGDFGDSLFNIIKGIILRPVHTIGVALQPCKLKYLFQLLGPLLFLPLLSPSVLFLCLPNLFLNLLSSNPNVASILYQYNSFLIPFIFIAAISSFKLLDRLIKRGGPVRCIAALMLLSGIVFSWRLGPQFHLFSRTWRPPVSCLPRYDFLTSRKWEMIDRIPPDVPVTTTFGFFAQLSNRRIIECFHYLLCGQYGIYPEKYVGRKDIEYALIDFGDPTTFVSFYRPGRSARNFRRFIRDNNLGLVDIYERIALYKRGEEDSFLLYERLGDVEGRRGEKQRRADFEGLELTSTDLEPVGQTPSRQLEFTSLWTARKKLEDDLSMIIRIEDESGRQVLEQVRSICYHMYPTSEWGEGEVVKANHLIALPPDLPPGRYRLKMLVIDKFPPNELKHFTAAPASIDRDGWLIAGEVEL